ncbi:MAG TPA: 4-(cytidine 5'-diphospho)-2-C-methyl-D-erythritol kinase [Acidimicrobiales bacterium]|nr:4-(cytidine 5'-diphospho)-2-C-methyl-D-erythritol kinase [Acidimicrobiales bacterium]
MTILHAHAKLTWSLEITGRRDDGYHELRSEMVTVDFTDRLIVNESADYLRVVTQDAAVPTDGSNLVVRALRLVGRRAGVTLEKHIPSGAGLGGGSADAAAILRWAGGVTNEQALSLGSDVPFCQLGGRALVEGVGERLTPLNFEAREVTLVLADFRVDTAQCYRAFDELVSTGWTPSGNNHLEVAAGLVEPRLARTLAWAREHLADEVRLAGSGSSMFVTGHLRGDVEHWDVEGPEGRLRLVQTTTTPA